MRYQRRRCNPPGRPMLIGGIGVLVVIFTPLRNLLVLLAIALIIIGALMLLNDR